MRFNRELRTRNMVIRFHILWVVFYIVLLSGVAAIAWNIYREHDEDQYPSGAIELKVGKEEYQLNEEITFKVKNNFPTTVFVTNSCPEEPLNVYRWQDEEWHQIHDKATNPDGECFKQPRRIAIKPNSALEYHFKDWPNLFSKAGVYRIVLDIDHYDDLPFQDFVVLKPLEINKDSTKTSQPSNSNQPNSSSTKKVEDSDEEIERENEHEVEIGD